MYFIKTAVMFVLRCWQWICRWRCRWRW